MCAKAFGPSVDDVRRSIEGMLPDSRGSVSFDDGVLSFPDTSINDVLSMVPDAEIGISLNVIELADEGPRLREVGLEAVQR